MVRFNFKDPFKKYSENVQKMFEKKAGPQNRHLHQHCLYETSNSPTSNKISTIDVKMRMFIHIQRVKNVPLG